MGSVSRTRRWEALELVLEHEQDGCREPCCELSSTHDAADLKVVTCMCTAFLTVCRVKHRNLALSNFRRLGMHSNNTLDGESIFHRLYLPLPSSLFPRFPN
jgi:hypothetical protein